MCIRDSPLYGLETRHPVRDFDILGFSLPYEQLYTNVLTMLDLAGIPLRAADRTADDPLVIAGGSACYNPEPMNAFFDAMIIGEGEEVIFEVIAAVEEWRREIERLEIERLEIKRLEIERLEIDANPPIPQSCLLYTSRCV